jgi:ABC-type lipoprotein release transport system permease subunit
LNISIWINGWKNLNWNWHALRFVQTKKKIIIAIAAIIVALAAIAIVSILAQTPALI